MKSNSECLFDEDGIEMNVSYLFEPADSDETEVQGMACVELKTVQIVIANKPINILPLMDDKQQQAIINLLKFDNE